MAGYKNFHFSRLEVETILVSLGFWLPHFFSWRFSSFITSIALLFFICYLLFYLFRFSFEIIYYQQFVDFFWTKNQLGIFRCSGNLHFTVFINFVCMRFIVNCLAFAWCSSDSCECFFAAYKYMSNSTALVSKSWPNSTYWKMHYAKIFEFKAYSGI